MTALPDSDAATSLVLMLRLVEQAADRVRDGGAVDDRAVDNAVGRQRLGAEAGHFVALAGGLQLDRLDGARTNVQADEGFSSTKHVVSCFPETPKQAMAKRFIGTSSLRK